MAGDAIGIAGGGAGDINHDGIPDLAIGAICGLAGRPARTPARPSSSTAAPPTWRRSTSPTARRTAASSWRRLDGTHGFVDQRGPAGDFSGRASGAGDVNGDHIDDLVIGATGAGAKPGQAYVVFGRDSTAGQVFPAALELSSLNGSNGFVDPGPRATDSLGRRASPGPATSTATGSATSSSAHCLASPSSGRTGAGQAYVIFGRTSFPASFNLASLNGSNGFTVNGAATNDLPRLFGGRGRRRQRRRRRRRR